MPFAQNTERFPLRHRDHHPAPARGLRILELPIPTYYGDEICHVNGIEYAFQRDAIGPETRAQGLGLLYDRRFESPSRRRGNAHYGLKTGYASPHTLAVDRVPAGSAGAGPRLRRRRSGRAARERQQGLPRDRRRPRKPSPRSRDRRSSRARPERGPARLDERALRLRADARRDRALEIPEEFVEQLREALDDDAGVKLMASTANVGFFVNRADAPVRPVQLRQARHPGSDAHAPVHVPVVPAPVRAGGFRVVETEGRAGAVSARARRQLAEPRAGPPSTHG